MEEINIPRKEDTVFVYTYWDAPTYKVAVTEVTTEGFYGIYQIRTDGGWTGFVTKGSWSGRDKSKAEIRFFPFDETRWKVAR